jgi:hypothetical protein
LTSPHPADGKPEKIGKADPGPKTSWLTHTEELSHHQARIVRGEVPSVLAA